MLIHGLAGVLSLIVIWQGVVTFTGVPAFILPSPFAVLVAFWGNWELIGEHLLVTLSEVIIGLMIGTFLGIITAILLAQSSTVRLSLRPILVFSQALPVFALAPILTLWFGYGLWSKVAMAVLIIYFPVTSSFFDGLMRTPIGFLDLAKTMNANSNRIMLKIRIPSALPSLASGFKLAAVYAPIGATIGEWVGSSQGLGYLMLLANGRAKTDLMFAAMLILGIVSMCIYFFVDLIAKKVTYPYELQ